MKFSVGKTIKNAGWLMGGKIVEMLISFIVSIFVARVLGKEGMGEMDYGISYATFFTAICTLGINSVLVKEFVDAETDEGTVLGTSLGLRFLSTVFSLMTIVGISIVLDWGEPATVWIVFLSALRLLFQIFEVFNYWFHAKLQSKFTAVILLVAYGLTSIYKIILLVLDAGVAWFAVSTSIDHACVALLLLVSYFVKGGKRLRFSFKYAGKLLRKSVHFILPSLMVAVYASVDKVMLRQMMGSAEVGGYGRAVTISTIFIFVFTAIIDSVHPSIMQAHKDGDMETYNRRNRQLYAIVFYLSTLMSCAFFVLAKPCILLLYSKEFENAIAPLRIITWYSAFSYLGVARGAWIVCENKQKHLIWVYAGAALVNVLLNWWLIPVWGACGAAVASVIAQVATSFIVPALIPALRPNAKLMMQAVFLIGVLPKRKKKTQPAVEETVEEKVEEKDSL